MDLTTLTDIFLLIIVQSILKTTGAQESKNVRDDYTYLNATEGFYKIHSSTTTWANAWKICAEEGATLFFPEDKIEAEEVKAFYNRNRAESDWTIHIGITDKLEEGIFETIDGRSIADVYNTWDVGQPNNNGEEDCVTFRKNGLLNDDNCDKGHHFICKMVVRSDEPRNHNNPNTRYIEKDYTFLNPFKSSYKMHRERRTWLEAKKICALEGAALFYPENEYEAKEVINSIVQKSYSWSDDIFIGISKLVAKWDFVTINGRPLADVYNKWDHDEPNNDGEEEHCLTIMKNLRLNDYRCHRSQLFICKRAYEDIKWDEDCNVPKSMAKIADLEKELANRTAVIKVMEREAQITKIQTANLTASLDDLEREVNQAKQPTCCNGIAEAVANQAAASERISKAAGENQAAALERISKAIDNQAAVLQLLIETMQRQALALEEMAKYEQ